MRLTKTSLIDYSGIDFRLPAADMATPKEEARGLFRQGVQAVLDSWAVLQIAVENGFGGAHSQEKAEWMVGAVEQYFESNVDLEPEEIEDFLAELMNNEFNTIIEDGSLAQVSQQLCLFFRQSHQGDTAAMLDAIIHLAQKKQEARRAVAKSQPAAESSSEEEQETEEEAMDCSAGSSINGIQSNPSPLSDGTTEDGWMLVTRKKK